MKSPDMRTAAALSAVLHITALCLLIFVSGRAVRMSMPSPYIVSLVGPDALPGTLSGESADKAESKVPSLETPADEKKSVMPPARSKSDIKRVEDRISELQAKQRVSRLYKLKNVLMVRASADGAGQKAKAGQTGSGKPGQAAATGSYTDKITSEIWKEWVFPDSIEGSLEAIISVRILKDGVISDIKMEKRSGNALFDRSALRAVTKASPITPPPYEMEIGIRFYP